MYFDTRYKLNYLNNIHTNMGKSRRNFIKESVAGATGLFVTVNGINTAGSEKAAGCRGSGNTSYNTSNDNLKSQVAEISESGSLKIPGEIAGMTLEELKEDYKNRIFNLYLPFWDKGGYDREFGGFMCELNDDGSIVNDEKYIWYQGRGIWAYSFLYNYFGKDKRYLEIAEKSREFLVKYMYMGEGKWRESVNRRGQPVSSTVSQGSAQDIYGALFAATGLVELSKATGNEEDLSLVKTSIWASVKAYDDPEYDGVRVEGVNKKGLRTQGHSFIMMSVLTNLLLFHKDDELEELQKEHVYHLMNHFWNPEYGIVNEDLFHDYSRIPGFEPVMYSGHSLEALWMIMDEALRINDKELFEVCQGRLRRVMEMTWDYVFGGFCTEFYYVFGKSGKCPGPEYDTKVMWAHAELLIATMKIYEITGEEWAREWYERGREFSLQYLANTGHGVWREAVDRFGENQKRPGISVYRKDNFHLIRYLMTNYLALDRMIKRIRI